MPVPYADFQVDALGRFEVDREGYVNASGGAGLGLDIDWVEVENMLIRKINVHQ